MSLGARASNKGGTRSGGGSSGGQTHMKHNHVSHKNTDKSQRGSASNDDLAAKFRDKVAQLMDMTQRSEEEICAALHDCDDDLVKACDLLFEEADGSQGQWKTKEKKKKKSVAVAGNSAVSGSEGESAETGSGVAGSADAVKGGTGGDRNDQTGRDRPPPRTRSNPRPYRGRGGDYQNSNDIDGHGQNNLDGGGVAGGPMRGGMGSRRGGRGGSSRGVGPGIGGRGGSRGGRGGRGGGRPMRGQRSSHYSQPANESPWDSQRNDGQVGADGFPSPEDWDNEEWSGSLADTKVFTPSGGGPGDSPVAGADAPILNHHGADLNSLQQHNNSNAGIGNSLQQEVNLNMGGSGVGVSSDYMKQGVDVLGMTMGMSMGNVSPPPSQQMHQHQQSPQTLTQDPAVYGYANSTSHHVSKAQSPVSLNVSSTLSAAQSQYLSQLTQQKSESLKQERNLLNSQQSYSTNYGVYGSDMSNQRKPLQRARVPPPSKIPSSAVEMPGELDSSSVGLLGVQFGAMDFNTDATGFLSESAPSSAAPNDKFNSNAGAMDHSLSDSSVGQQNSSSSLDSLQTSAPSTMVNDVSPSPYAVSSNNSSHVLTSESLSAAVAVEQASSGLSGPGGQQYTSVSQSQPASRGQQPSAHVSQQLTTVAGIESQLTGKSSSSATEGSQQSVYSSYPGQATYKHLYQHPHPAYPANPYSQVNSSVPSFSAVQSLASGNASVTYPPTNTLNQYQHTQPINTYQNSSAYGNSGLYTAASVPYNNYQTSMQTNSNKLSSNVKDSQYESAVTSASNSLSNTPSAQSTQSSKSTTSLGKSIATSGLSSGSGSSNAGHVNPMIGQYIMSQPFYSQPPLAYTYEEMQMMQQRIPHHMAGYYEVGYGSSGGGGAVRDASMPSFTSIGSADGRFGRADAPSPSQQAQVGHQALQPLQQGQQAQGQAQPPATAAMLGATGAAMPPYTAYFYGGNIVPGSFQPYATQPMYQIAAGGSAASSSYASGKGVGVGGVGVGGGGGGYASGAASYAAPQPQSAAQPLQQYDTQQVAAPVALPQPAPQHNAHQDYKTGGYSSTQQTSVVKQSGVSNSTSAATDLNSAMYGGGKTHVSLNKVNSYDKVAYNSATPPPPFGLGAGGVGVGVGSGAGYAPQQHLYLQHTHSQMPPPQQQHHQPQHQMDVRVANRRDNGTNSSRGGSSGGSKQGGGGGGGGGAKQAYSGYWNQN